MSIREQLKEELAAAGWTPVESRTAKYEVMVNAEGSLWAFLGRCGALRMNTQNTVTGSLSYNAKSYLAKLRVRREQRMLSELLAKAN